MNKIKQQFFSLDKNGQRAFWLTSLFAVLLLGYSMTMVGRLFHQTWIIRLLSEVTPLVAGLVALLASIIIFSGRAREGGYLFLVGVPACLVFLTFVLEGAAFLLAVIVFMLITYMASLTLPRERFTWSPIAGIGVGALVLLVDAYAYWERDLISPADNQLAMIIGGVFLLVYLAFMVVQFREFPITTKLVVTSMALSLIPVALIAVMSNMSSRIALEGNAKQSLLSSASQVAASLDAFVLNNMDIIRVESRMNEVVEMLGLDPRTRAGSETEEDVNSMLSAFQRRDPINITSYALYDRNGVVIADTVNDEVGKIKSDRQYFQEPIKTGLPYVSPVTYSAETGDPSIYFSAPVYDERGEILGVIRARYSADVLQQTILRSSGKMSSQAFVALVDPHSSTFLANSEAPDHIYRSYGPVDEANLANMRAQLRLADDVPAQEIYFDITALSEGLSQMDQSPNFVGEFHTEQSIDSHGHVAHQEQAGTARMSTQPWVVVVGEPEKILYEPVDRQTRGTLVMGVVAAFGAIFFAMLTARYIAGPVTRLTDTANQFAQGHLEAKAAITSRDEIGVLANSFNSMAAQLRGLIGSLEQRVADRTRALAASAEVSRRLSTILDQGELVKEVVNQLQSAFNYYHVHIYLYDTAREYLVMAGGTGDAGKTMLSRGHRLRKGLGLVGRAAETGVPVLYEDVRQADGWLPNPLLPDTQAELAVPITMGDTVMGVLDVQENQVGKLMPEDVDLLQSIASQVAIALRNAANYTQAEQRATREALVSSIGQRIQQTTSPEEALKIAVREIGRALGSDYTTVQLNVRSENGSKASQ